MSEIKDSAKRFLKELGELLDRFNVEITAEDEWEGYAECGEDIQIRIETTNRAGEYYSVSLGNSISTDDIKRMLND